MDRRNFLIGAGALGLASIVGTAACSKTKTPKYKVGDRFFQISEKNGEFAHLLTITHASVDKDIVYSVVMDIDGYNLKDNMVHVMNNRISFTITEKSLEELLKFRDTSKIL